MRRLASSLVVLTMLGALSACGDEAPAPAPRDLGAESKAANDTWTELEKVFSEPQLAGGKLVASIDEFSFELTPNGQKRVDTRLRNEGDVPVILTSIETAVRAEEITFDNKGCAAGTVLPPDQACDLFVVVSDKSGRVLDNEILILSDAKKTPTLRIALKVDIEQPGAPPAPSKQKPVVAKKTDIPYDQIDAINQMRRMSGWGGTDPLPEPTKQIVEQENAYPDGMFATSEATLPVLRKRILTEDRVIKAVLETPYNNIMCSKVIAVTDSDTWGADQFPGQDQPLLPAGTRFIGACNAFTDEKSAIVWTRFITPNGVSGQIVGAANDAMGRGGLPGHLDRRWFDKYGVPIIFSTFRSALEWMLTKGEEATATITNPETGITSETSTATTRAVDRFQGDMTRILDNVMQELQDTQQVLTIPGGTRIDIVLGQDIVFKDPYTVIAVGDDEYELPEKKRQQLYRTTPKPIVAGVEGGAVAEPSGATKVTIDGKDFWLMPASISEEEKKRRSSDGAAQQ